MKAIRRKYKYIATASYPSLAKEYGVNTSTIRAVIQYLGYYSV